jgi:hypothetical protein
MVLAEYCSGIDERSRCAEQQPYLGLTEPDIFVE